MDSRPLRLDRNLRLLTMAAWLLSVCTPLRADDFTISGTGLIPSSPTPVVNAAFVNLYTEANWDSDVPPGVTMKAMNDFTAAVIASRYFGSAGQYGIGSPTFSGSVVSTCSLTGLPNPSDEDLASLVTCNVTNGTIQSIPGANRVVNVFLPQSVKPRRHFTIHVLGIAQDTLVDRGPCDGFGAFHSAASPLSGLLGIVPFTVVPTNTDCNGNMAALTESLTHEMIEVVTDPVFPAGWAHHTGFLDLNLVSDSDKGEAADVCQSGEKTTTPSAFAFLAPSNFAIIHGTPGHPTSATPNDPNFPTAAFYWSNSEQICAPAFSTDNLAAPGVGTVSVIPDTGVLPNLTVTVQGIHFGTLPAAFSSRSSLPYFEWKDGTQTSGNSIWNGGERGAWQFSSWSDSEIIAKVPASDFPVKSCDATTVTVLNPQNGKAGSQAFTVPGAAHLKFSALPAIVYAGVDRSVTITGVDAAGHPVVGPLDVTVTITNQQGSSFTNPHVQRLSGQPVFANVPGRYAGRYVFDATTTACNGGVVLNPDLYIDIAPFGSVQPGRGPAAGGTRVTLQGGGFTQGSTSVYFGSKAATGVQVLSDTQLTATTPPGSGTVPVTVKSNGIRSDDVPATAYSVPVTFTYFTPGVPVLSAYPGCGNDVVDAAVYDAAGNPEIGKQLNWSISNSGTLAHSTTLTDNSGASTNFATLANLPAPTVTTAGVNGSSQSATVNLPAPNSGCPAGHAPPNLFGGGKLGACLACSAVDVRGSFSAPLTALVQFGAVQLDGSRRYRPEKAAGQAEFSRGLEILTGRASALSTPLPEVGAAAQALTYDSAKRILAEKLHVGDAAGRRLIGVPSGKRGSSVVTRLEMAQILYRTGSFIAQVPKGR